MQNRLIMKIPILRYDGKTFPCCKFPNGSITALAEAAIVHVRRVRKQIRQPVNEPGRQIFIEQELHQRQSLFCVRDRPQKRDRLGYLPQSVRKIAQDLLVGHARSQIIEDVVNRYAQASDARFTAALSRFYRDDLRIIHSQTVQKQSCGVKPEAALYSTTSSSCVPSTPTPPETRSRPSAMPATSKPLDWP